MCFASFGDSLVEIKIVHHLSVSGDFWCLWGLHLLVTTFVFKVISGKWVLGKNPEVQDEFSGFF